MKYITIFFVLVVGLFVLLYVTLFTPLGNTLVKPFVEQEIQKQTHLDSKLELFSLDSKSIELLVVLNKENSIYIKANYSLLQKSFNGVYRVKFLALQTLEKLSHIQLQGVLHSEGSIVGDIDSFRVKGVSNVASSHSTYQVKVEKLKVESLQASISSAQLKEILFIFKQKDYADANINLALDFKNVTPHNLDGEVKLTTTQGYLNTKVLRDEFGISVAKNTNLEMQLDAKLKGDDVLYSYTLNSNLAKMKLNGSLVPEPLSLEFGYKLYIKELALLKSLSGVDIRGALNVEGKVQGDKKDLLVSAKTDLASSNTKVALQLHNLQLKSIKATLRDLKVQNALYMLKLPHYTDANLDMDILIKNAQIGNLDGVVRTKLSKGHLDSKYLTKAYEFSSLMPKTNFSLQSTTKLKGSRALSEINLYSNLIELHTTDSHYEMKKKVFKSDYNFKIKDLNDFYFLSQRALKGSLLARGNISKSENFDLEMHTNIADGKVKMQLHNDDLRVKLEELQTLKILDMLLYPKVFDGSVNGDIIYDLKKEHGTLDAKFRDAKVTKNKVLDLTKKYAHVDMYVEKFTGDMQAKLVKEKVIATLFLKSNRSSIKSKNAKLNLKSNEVNALLDVNANNNPIKVTLKGNINTPKVTVSADELIKREATKIIHKELGKFLRKFF